MCNKKSFENHIGENEGAISMYTSKLKVNIFFPLWMKTEFRMNAPNICNLKGNHPPFDHLNHLRSHFLPFMVHKASIFPQTLMQ